MSTLTLFNAYRMAEDRRLEAANWGRSLIAQKRLTNAADVMYFKYARMSMRIGKALELRLSTQK